MRRHAVGLWVLAAAVSLSARPEILQTQETLKRIVLGPPTATHPGEFSGINSVRELRDGRLLVTDGSENRLVVLDFVAKSVTAIGRTGRGPGEYAWVGWLHPLAADSTLMWDILARRYLVLSEASIVGTSRPDDPAVLATGGGMVLGADELGRLLREYTPIRPEGVTETGNADSTSLVLVDRATARADTVARTWNAPKTVTAHYKADGTLGSSGTIGIGVMSADEKALLLADGTLAVARLDPFRIDWRSPTGAWTRGAPLPVSRVRFDARERRAYAERIRRNAANSRPRPNYLPPPPPPPSEFPAFVPPFVRGSEMLRGPKGTLLLQRARSSAVTGNHYLVIDRSGRLLGEIALPLERTIIGAGPSTIYVAVKDADDVLRIQRHPWP